MAIFDDPCFARCLPDQSIKSFGKFQQSTTFKISLGQHDAGVSVSGFHSKITFEKTEMFKFPEAKKNCGACSIWIEKQNGDFLNYGLWIDDSQLLNSAW